MSDKNIAQNKKNNNVYVHFFLQINGRFTFEYNLV